MGAETLSVHVPVKIRQLVNLGMIRWIIQLDISTTLPFDRGGDTDTNRRHESSFQKLIAPLCLVPVTEEVDLPVRAETHRQYEGGVILHVGWR